MWEFSNRMSGAENVGFLIFKFNSNISEPLLSQSVGCLILGMIGFFFSLSMDGAKVPGNKINKPFMS